MRKVLSDNSSDTANTVWVTVTSMTTDIRWAAFERLLRRSADTTPYCGSVEQSDTATDNVVMKYVAAREITGQSSALQLGSESRLAQIESRFASKHRSKATKKAFDRMYKAVNEAVDSLSRSLNGNLASIVLSGPLADAQVGDRSVDLLVVLYSLPESVYKLSKQLSADVLYPIFKAHGVFPGMWCTSLDEWKRSLSSASAAAWTRKQQGVVIFGEESLGQPAG